MAQTVIITSKYYKTVASVVRGTSEQIRSILAIDPQAHGFQVNQPSDWMYSGESIDLDCTTPYNACRDILKGVAKLPQHLRWMI